MSVWLGLDVGTTRVCALAFEAGRGVRARAWRPVATRFPAPGRVEQDPGALWQAGRDALRELLERAGLAARQVAGLGLATQRGSALAWSTDGEPLAALVGWQDQRGAERAAELRARGVPITALPTATKLEWLLRHEPRVAAAARAGRLRLGTPDVWLLDRLSGGRVFATEPGNASATALYDLRYGDWHPGALALFGIPRETLPEVGASDALHGETAATLLGAPVRLCAQAGDQQASCFAQGVLSPGEAKLTLGTAAMLDLHTGDRARRARHGAYPLALWRVGNQTSFCVEATVPAAGAAVEWLAAVGLLPSPEALDAVAGEVEDAEGVVFLPALQGLGSPWLDDSVRGFVGGMHRGTTRAHLARALIDGIAHRCVDLLDAAGVAEGELRVDGGLAASALLRQRLADLAGRVLAVASEPETTALGAALLAALGGGGFDSPRACQAGLDPPTRIEPGLEPARRGEQRARWRAHVASLLDDPSPQGAREA